MKRLFLFAILSLMVLGFYFIQQSVYAQLAPIEESVRQQILAATVQIKMSAPRTDEIGNPIIAENNGEWHVVNEMAHGLGTVTQIDNQLFIVTHDHWGGLLRTAVSITFQNADGTVLTEINGDTFRASIVYADQGTMVLQLPATLSTIAASASDHNANPLNIGHELYLTRHQAGPDKVEVVLAQVISVTQQNGPLTYYLENLDGTPVVGGDSGGGLWANGQFAGNLWQNIQIETVHETELGNERKLTPYSIAAAIPNITPYLSTDDEAEVSQMTPQSEKERP